MKVKVKLNSSLRNLFDGYDFQHKKDNDLSFIFIHFLNVIITHLVFLWGVISLI